jgi:hypothetical protein
LTQTMEEGKGLGHRVRRVLVWILQPYLVLAAFYLLVVFRLHLRPINDVVRVFNKRLLNPVIMALDRRHWYAAVLEHKGRRSGNVISHRPEGRGLDASALSLALIHGYAWKFATC